MGDILANHYRWALQRLSHHLIGYAGEHYVDRLLRRTVDVLLVQWFDKVVGWKQVPTDLVSKSWVGWQTKLGVWYCLPHIFVVYELSVLSCQVKVNTNALFVISGKIATLLTTIYLAFQFPFFLLHKSVPIPTTPWLYAELIYGCLVDPHTARRRLEISPTSRNPSAVLFCSLITLLERIHFCNNCWCGEIDGLSKCYLPF
jgi:hypothetical protein